MPKIDHIKCSFVGGQFGSSLFGRTDIAQYDYACEIVQNFLIRPYGSVITTPGTEYINTVSKSTLATRIIPFVFSRTDAYIIEMGEYYFKFYTNGGVVITTGTTPFQLAHVYDESELFDVQFAQINDLIYMFHPDNPPQVLTRNAAASWTMAEFAVVGGPFMDDNTDDTKTIIVSNSTGTVNLTANSNIFTPSASTLGHVNTYWKIGGVLTNSTTGLEVQGYVKISAVATPSTATATVIKTLTVTGSTTSWAEGAWSDVNGYPACVTFHEGRMWAARTDAQPQNIWGSKTFIYDDFLPGAEDDDGIALEFSSNESNDIKWLSSARSLTAGTYGGEFVIQTGDNTPITPSNVSVKKETSWGSEAIIPKKIGNFLFYIQRFFKKVRELYYDFNYDAWRSTDRTILSPEISGDGIIDTAFQQNPDSILWCVTSNGTIATLTREIDQEVAGWSEQTTDGLYESVAVIPSQEGPYDEVWVVVKRTIQGTATRYIERFGDIVVPDRQDLCFYVHSGLKYNAYDQTTGSTLTLSNTAGTVVGGTLSGIVLTISPTTASIYFATSDIGQRIRAIDSEGVTLGEVEITAFTSSSIVIGEVKKSFTITSYTGTLWGLSVNEISGLDHLKAETVVVLADGGLDKPDKVVTTNGTITLAYDYFIVNVGLPYDQTIYTLPIEGGSQRGTAQGKIQKINQVALKVNRSHKGFYIGGNTDLLERVNFRDPSTYMGTPELLYTGIMSNINFRDDYRYGSQVMIVNRDPVPMEILNIISTLTTEEKP